MGWATGSEIADDVWKTVRPLTNESNRKKVAKKLVDIFENYDCDTMYETKVYEDAK